LVVHGHEEDLDGRVERSDPCFGRGQPPHRVACCSERGRRRVLRTGAIAVAASVSTTACAPSRTHVLCISARLRSRASPPAPKVRVGDNNDHAGGHMRLPGEGDLTPPDTPVRTSTASATGRVPSLCLPACLTRASPSSTGLGSTTTLASATGVETAVRTVVPICAGGGEAKPGVRARCSVLIARKPIAESGAVMPLANTTLRTSFCRALVAVAAQRCRHSSVRLSAEQVGAVIGAGRARAL
jgi:hypothetical protein